MQRHGGGSEKPVHRRRTQRQFGVHLVGELFFLAKFDLSETDFQLIETLRAGLGRTTHGPLEVRNGGLRFSHAAERFADEKSVLRIKGIQA